MTRKIALIGASGFLGRYVAEALSRAGFRLSLATRNRERHKADLLPLPGCELIECNVHDEKALARLLAGHDAVISMVGILHGKRADFERAHVQLAGKIIAACQQQGIRRIVHVSALGAAENAPSDYQQTKGKAESLLKQSALDVTILRPSVIFGAGDSFLTLFASLSAKVPFIPLAGAATRFAPVWVGDVARAVAISLQDDSTIGQQFDLTGPHVYTLRELVAYAANLGGHPRCIIALPEGLAMLQAGLMECLPGQPPLSRDNVRSLRVDNVSEQPFPSRFGTPAALESIAPGYLGTHEFNHTMCHYRESAGR